MANIKKLVRKYLIENIDSVLDKINDVGINNLTELDKLKLGSYSDNQELLDRIQLMKLFRENGGTFGNYKIKVRVKPINKQEINHKLSKEYENEVGYLAPYYNQDDNNIPYGKVKFDKIEQYSPMDFGNPSSPIYLKNLQIIGYKE